MLAFGTGNGWEIPLPFSDRESKECSQVKFLPAERHLVAKPVGKTTTQQMPFRFVFLNLSAPTNFSPASLLWDDIFLCRQDPVLKLLIWIEAPSPFASRRQKREVGDPGHFT